MVPLQSAELRMGTLISEACSIPCTVLKPFLSRLLLGGSLGLSK